MTEHDDYLLTSKAVEVAEDNSKLDKDGWIIDDSIDLTQTVKILEKPEKEAK